MGFALPPPDLVELLCKHRLLIGGRGSFDWLLSDPAEIQERLDWPFEGFWFDVEHNQAWWPEWGAKPEVTSERRDRLKQIFAHVPKLIPLFAHRYMPDEPFETGNPIFSVYQTDVIYYGSDLQNWLQREGMPSRRFGLLLDRSNPSNSGPKRSPETTGRHIPKIR